MKILFTENSIKYDGTQLKSLYNYLEHGLLGDSILAFRGACNVSFEHMVDGEDLRAKAQICSDEMVHFLIEIFDQKLMTAVALQRLFAAQVQEVLQALTQVQLRREGDDLYRGDHKLSISIATVSPVSALIHFAVNVTNKGTPVKTLSLEDLNIEPQIFAQEVIKRFQEEFLSIQEATKKVHWVK